MVKLDIVTPFTRLGNLGRVWVSLREAWSYFDTRWYVIHDCQTGGCDRVPPFYGNGDVIIKHIPGVEGDAGWTQRNWHLDHGRPDAYIMWLDDDCVAHPEIFRDFREFCDVDPLLLAVVYAMSYPHCPNYPPLVGNPNHVAVGSISGSMVVAHRSSIGDLRAQTRRTADGFFWHDWWEALKNHKSRHPHVYWTDKPYVMYNTLNPDRPQ